MKRILATIFICFCCHVYVGYAGEVQDIRPDSDQTTIAKSDYAGSYTVQNGDRVNVTVYGEPDLSKIYTVDAMGMISVPLIGTLKIAGMNTHDITAALYQRFTDGYFVDPDITVTMAEYQPVSIMGEVRAPGEYKFKPGMTVLTAAAVAGGFTYRANQKAVDVLRKHSDGAESSYQELPIEATLESGDIVLVKERFF